MAKADITAVRLRELLHYDHQTGVFRWASASGRWGRIAAGSVAGSNHNGYIKIGLDGRDYLAHRLAWLYSTGSFPTHGIDHLDGNQSNNALSNLRDSTQAVNVQNLRAAKSNNVSRLLGVSFCQGRWQARIQRDGVVRYLGRFPSPEAAHAAYISAKRNLHPGCTI